MSKGEQTREKILKRAALVFNKRGYSGATIADIMEETGLEKGGIYNHFKNKEELALASFEYASNLILQPFQHVLKTQNNAYDRLLAFIQIFRENAANPPISGGCPILNTAVEADDTNPALRTRARQVFDTWYSLIRWTIIEGVENKELKSDTNAEIIASLFISSYEGAAMLGRLYRDSSYIYRICDYLTALVQTLKVT